MPFPFPVILVVCTAVPDFPFRTARADVDVHVPVAVVALVKRIVNMREMVCGFAPWAGTDDAISATKK